MRVWVGWIIDPPQDPPFAGPTLMSRVNAGCCSFVCRAVQEQLPTGLLTLQDGWNGLTSAQTYCSWVGPFSVNEL